MFQPLCKLKLWTPAACATALLLFAVPAQAQIHVPVYTGTPLMIAAGVVNRQALESSLRPLQSGADDAEAPIGARALQRPGAYADKLAETYPAGQREEARRTFSELLDGYRSIEQRFDIPAGELAGAVAAFVAGSLMAYRDTGFPDASFGPLVEQMRAVLAATPELAAASPLQIQESYEQMAILGMFMATTQMALKERPDPALRVRLQAAARGYLEQFLKTDAERLQITATGLGLR